MTEIAELHRDHRQLRGVLLPVVEKEITAESTERRRTEDGQRRVGQTLETRGERMEGKITANIAKNSKVYEGNKEERKAELSGTDTLKDRNTDKERQRREDMGTNEDTVTNRTNMWAILLNNYDAQKQDKEEDDKKFLEINHMDKQRQDMEEEERESMLVAGLNIHIETREEDHEGKEKLLTVNREYVVTEGSAKNNQREDDHIVTPSSSAFSAELVKESVAQTQNPLSSPHPNLHHSITPSLPVTPTQVPAGSPHPRTSHSPHFFPSSTQTLSPLPIKHISASTVTQGEVRSVSLLHHLKNELEVKADPSLEDLKVKNILLNSAHEEVQTTRGTDTKQQPQEAEFVPEVQTATAEPKDTKFTAKNFKNKIPNFTPKSNENNLTAKPVAPTRKPNMTKATRKTTKTVKQMGQDTMVTAKRNGASPPQPLLTKPSAKTLPTSAKTPPLTPAKINKGGKSQTIKSKVNKKKKQNKTQKPPEKKKVVPPTHFPYFMDNYCPPQCACYGR